MTPPRTLDEQLMALFDALDDALLPDFSAGERAMVALRAAAAIGATDERAAIVEWLRDRSWRSIADVVDANEHRIVAAEALAAKAATGGEP